MSNIIGRIEDVGIGLESTRGTAVTPTYWLPSIDKDYDDRANFIIDDSALGVLGENSAATVQKQWSDGSIKGRVYQSSIGVLLAMLAGQSPSSNTVSGETTHTFTQANNVTNKSATIAFKDANVDLAFVNAMLDSTKFNFDLDNFFNYEAQFMGRKSATAANSVTRSLENFFAPKHAFVKLATSQSGLNAAATVKVRSASVTFVKNVEEKQNLGSVDIDDVLNKTLQVTGALEVYYTDTTYKDYMFNQTERALRLAVTNTDVTITSNNPHLYFDLYRVRFSDWEKKKGLSDIVTETVNFTGLVDLGNAGKVYTIELLNGVSSY